MKCISFSTWYITNTTTPRQQRRDKEDDDDDFQQDFRIKDRKHRV